MNISVSELVSNISYLKYSVDRENTLTKALNICKLSYKVKNLESFRLTF